MLKHLIDKQKEGKFYYHFNFNSEFDKLPKTMPCIMIMCNNQKYGFFVDVAYNTKRKMVAKLSNYYSRIVFDDDTIYTSINHF